MNATNINRPKISIVTPSFNQGAFLEQAITSVLEQNYPNLEYIIIDGGSSDNSCEIIKKYEKHLTYWASEKDRGQYHAINKGFSRSTGEIMAWLNSDDMYCKWALKAVADIFTQNARVEWITSSFPMLWGPDGLAAGCFERPGFCEEAFYEGRYSDLIPKKSLCYIQQESTFWRRSLWDRAGGDLSETMTLAGDFELWARFFERAVLYGVSIPLSGFRSHGNQKSRQIEAYRRECRSVLGRYQPGVRVKIRDAIRSLQIQNIPLLTKFVHEKFGYDTYSIHCSIEGETSKWLVRRSKRLF